MCGIAGILRVTSAKDIDQAAALARDPREVIPESWLDILDASIAHRGPDGAGRFRDRAVRSDGSVVDVALVHRRLSIIDHAGGGQPMVSERGEKEGEGLVAVVFNGCIYNHRELRRELQAAGRRFVTDHSDTEVLVHGWREWGEGTFERLRGMFAMLIWDAGLGRVAMARDPFGEKPLYHLREPARAGRVWAAASTAAALLRLRAGVGLPVQASPTQVKAWVRYGFGWHSATEVRAVLPGTAVLTRANQYPLRFHSVAPWREPAVVDADPSDADIDELLRGAVEKRLEADVPLACFLSGGIDSALVSAYARRALGTLRTFTVRMPDPDYDESAFAARVANHLDTDHTCLDCAAQPARDLVRLIGQIGVPFGDSSLLPAFWLSHATREHTSVALSGDGGDEMFAGYERYRAADWLQRWSGVLGLVPAGLLDVSAPKARSTKLARLAVASRYRDYRQLVALFAPHEINELFPGLINWGQQFDEVMDAFDPSKRWKGKWYYERDSIVGADSALTWDRLVYLPHDLMRKTDSASMSVALEVRAPFLDEDILRTVRRLGAKGLMPRGQRKGLLKQVARKYLPREIVDRPKMGFAIPIGEWFRTDYGGMKTLLMDRLHSVEPFGPPSLGIDLNMRFVEQMLDEHMRMKRDHSQRLYMLLVLSIWADWLGRVGRGRA